MIIFNKTDKTDKNTNSIRNAKNHCDVRRSCFMTVVPRQNLSHL